MKYFDRVAHILLLIGLGVAGAAVYTARSDPRSQLTVFLLAVAFYGIWGMVYHHLRGDLARRLAVEYLVLAAIALVVGYLVFGQ